jgi:hypothetical protein
VRQSVQVLLHDIKEAFEAAQDVVSRGYITRQNWKMATEGGGRHSPSTVV